MTWVSEGQQAWFMLEEIRQGGLVSIRKMILCTVSCAMGDKARVVNEEYGIDTWADVDELEEVKESP